MIEYDVSDEQPMDIVKLEPHRDDPEQLIGRSLLGDYARRIVFFNDPRDQTLMQEGGAPRAVVWLSRAKDSVAEGRLVALCPKSEGPPHEVLARYYSKVGMEMPEEYSTDIPIDMFTAACTASETSVWRPGNRPEEPTVRASNKSGPVPDSKEIYEFEDTEYELRRGYAHVFLYERTRSDIGLDCLRFRLVYWPRHSSIPAHPVEYYGLGNLFTGVKDTPRGCAEIIWPENWVLNQREGVYEYTIDCRED